MANKTYSVRCVRCSTYARASHLDGVCVGCLEPSERKSAAERAADRLTLEFSSRSRVPVDGVKEPIEHSPLFGGAPQISMFDTEVTTVEKL